MDYKRLFDILRCHILVIFDDDLACKETPKTQIIRDFITMDYEDQEEIVSEIQKKHPEVGKGLHDLKQNIDPFYSIINWNEDIPVDDFESIFDVLAAKCSIQDLESIKESYYQIDDKVLASYCDLLSLYGVCMEVPECYAGIIENSYRNDGHRRKIRVYRDFTSETKTDFINILSSSSIDKSIICIIDNCLKGENKAREILTSINDATEKQTDKNIIGSIFTSKEELEQIDDNLCFVYTSKDKNTMLFMNIIRSAYHYFLKVLHCEINNNISQAFEKAKQNKNIANFLSQRAVNEGISDYQVMQNWIHFMSELQSKDSKTVKRLISLAQIIGELEEDDEEAFDTTLINELNMNEAFDYNINSYFLPTAPGDIFEINDALYVLIGQDCDMMMAEKRERRIAAAELLKVELIPITTVEKIKNNLEDVFISNYWHTDNKAYCMKIDYQHRCYADSRILDLCSYQLSGSCRINLVKGIDDSEIELVQKYLLTHFSKLQLFFQSIKRINDSFSDELNSMLKNKYTIITPNDYSENMEELIFPVKRICRLRQTYVFYLFKLFLEYRGRQPFDTINYAASNYFPITVKFGDKEAPLDVTVCLGKYADDTKIEKLIWYIEIRNLNELLKKFSIDGILDENLERLELKNKINDVSLKNGIHIKIEKKKKCQAVLTVSKAL